MSTPRRRRRVSAHRLHHDAVNRALRGMYVAVLVALIVDVLPLVLAALEPGGHVDPAVLVRAALHCALQAAGAYALRRYADPSGVPTPLPPSDPGPPAEAVAGV